MKPTSRSAAKVLMLVAGLVLLCSSFALAIAREAGAVVKRNSIVKVDASKRVSANQKFSQLWQLKGAKDLWLLRVDFPGRVFVSQSSDISSTYDAEVTVSGSSEAAITAVDVSFGTEMALDLKLATSPKVGEFLLVEVRVRAKNSLTNIVMTSANDGDLVVLKDVLISAAQSSASPLARRLQSSSPTAGNSNDLVALTRDQFAKVTTTKNSNGFSVAEDVHVSSRTATARTWLIKKPETVAWTTSAVNVKLELGLPGVALVDSTLSYLSYPDLDAGRVMVLGDNLDSLDQVEVVSTHGSSGETVQVRFKTKTGAPVPGNFTTLVGFSEALTVTTTPASDTSVQVHRNTLGYDHTEGYKILLIDNRGSGNIFISAPESLIALSFMNLANFGNGSIQVDVGQMWTISATSLDNMGSGPMSYFGDVIYSTLRPTPYANGTICASAPRHDFDRVLLSNRKSQDLVSFTGQPEGFGTFPCEKRALPERVPAEFMPGRNSTSKTATDDQRSSGQLIGSSASSSTSLSGAVTITGLFLAVLTLI